MGDYAIKLPVKIIAWLVATILVALNMQLIIQEVIKVLENNSPLFLKIIVLLGLLLFVWLFISMSILPLKGVSKKEKKQIHTKEKLLGSLEIPQTKK